MVTVIIAIDTNLRTEFERQIRIKNGLLECGSLLAVAGWSENRTGIMQQRSGARKTMAMVIPQEGLHGGR